jgi:hypothetical protein
VYRETWRDGLKGTSGRTSRCSQRPRALGLLLRRISRLHAAWLSIKRSAHRMRIDEPIRLTRGFWLLYLVTLGPVLWLTQPSLHDLPGYARVAAALLLPFLSALVAYLFYHFMRALVTDFAGQRVAFVSFAVVLCAVLIALTIAWYSGDFENLPWKYSFAAAFTSQLLFALCENWWSGRRKSAEELRK